MHALLTNSLRDRCLSLSASDRAQLAQVLLCSLGDCGAIRHPEDEMRRMQEGIRGATGVDVRARNRHQPIPQYKAAFILLARQRLPVTLTEVGRFLDLDHSTVVFHEKRMRDALDIAGSDPDLVRRYEEINEICKK